MQESCRESRSGECCNSVWLQGRNAIRDVVVAAFVPTMVIYELSSKIVKIKLQTGILVSLLTKCRVFLTKISNMLKGQI